MHPWEKPGFNRACREQAMEVLFFAVLVVVILAIGYMNGEQAIPCAVVMAAPCALFGFLVLCQLISGEIDVPDYEYEKKRKIRRAAWEAQQNNRPRLLPQEPSDPSERPT